MFDEPGSVLDHRALGGDFQWIQEGITGIISWIAEQWNRLPGYVQSLIITVVAITASAAAVSLLGAGLLGMAAVAIIGGLANIWRYVSSTEKKDRSASGYVGYFGEGFLTGGGAGAAASKTARWVVRKIVENIPRISMPSFSGC